jgi:NADPH:quinone reductase
MRAALYDRTGPAAEVLRVAEVDRPEPGPGEVRVRVALSGVNPTDWKARSGAVPRPIDGFQIPHQDGAGVIDAVGDGVDPGRIGQRVWLFMAAAGRRWGTAAEWTVLPARQAVALPDGVSWELAAALGVPAMTAHRCVFAAGPVAGQTVLVAGGAGAVGHYAIELAKQGGDHVINYRDPDAADQIRALGAPADRVVELSLAQNLALDLAVCRPHARIAVYAADGQDPVLPTRLCMTANVTLEFVLLYGVQKADLDQAAADITLALADGALTELPVTSFPLAQAAAAQDAVENGTVGKVVVAP